MTQAEQLITEMVEASASSYGKKAAKAGASIKKSGSDVIATFKSGTDARNFIDDHEDNLPDGIELNPRGKKVVIQKMSR